MTERNGTPILLRELAQVKIAPALKFGDALIMGKPGVMMSLASQYGANTLTATLAVEKALNELAPTLKSQGITLYPGLHRPANFIERALGNLEHSLLIAAILILAVLYLFLRDVRAALIAFTAIPLSLLAAIAVLDRMGFTLNTMTLGGFAVALGVLVDDAIIGIENILRRLRENRHACAARCRDWTWCGRRRSRFAARSSMRPPWSSRCFCRNCSPPASRVTSSDPWRWRSFSPFWLRFWSR